MLAKFSILLMMISILLTNVFGLELYSPAPAKLNRSNFPAIPLPHIQQQYSAENMAKIDEMRAKSNELRKKICNLNVPETRDFSEKIDECNKLNHISRIEVKLFRILFFTKYLNFISSPFFFSRNYLNLAEIYE